MSGQRRQTSNKTAHISTQFSIILLGGIVLAVVLVVRDGRNLRSATVNVVSFSTSLAVVDANTLEYAQRKLDPIPANKVKNQLDATVEATAIVEPIHHDVGTTSLDIINENTSRTAETQHHVTTATTKMSLSNIDLVSIGSILKPEWQVAQLRTFGSHPSVRNYFRVNEHNDTDVTCSTNFTDDQLRAVIRFCNNTDPDIQSFDSVIIRKKLFWPKRHTGWLCAQKRPVDGLYLALRSYHQDKYDRNDLSSLPSFLVIMDDDTYINMDVMIETTLSTYDITESHVIAGCRFTYPRKIQFAFAYGGFGTFLTRAAIQRLLEPIYCNHEHVAPSSFVKWACWRLDQNLLGEANVFRPGMSLGTLMYEYATYLPFTGIEAWDTVGYCLHSDHALGYFFNYYHVGVPEHILIEHEYSDKIRVAYSYEFMVGGQECANEKNSCLPEHRICHYIRPERMDEIYAKQQQIRSSG